mmetsp:Transcript_54486/g.129888  ORF Transcript_54486/g.129888 Transcript_54486/m.129888 type:complete len:218 (+) Transcript_54486:209-862(+)
MLHLLILNDVGPISCHVGLERVECHPSSLQRVRSIIDCYDKLRALRELLQQSAVGGHTPHLVPRMQVHVLRSKGVLLLQEWHLGNHHTEVEVKPMHPRSRKELRPSRQAGSGQNPHFSNLRHKPTVEEIFPMRSQGQNHSCVAFSVVVPLARESITSLALCLAWTHKAFHKASKSLLSHRHPLCKLLARPHRRPNQLAGWKHWWTWKGKPLDGIRNM